MTDCEEEIKTEADDCAEDDIKVYVGIHRRWIYFSLHDIKTIIFISQKQLLSGVVLR